MQAFNCRADETATEAMLINLDARMVPGLPEKHACSSGLGSPASRGKLVFQEADGNYVGEGDYPIQGHKSFRERRREKSQG